MIRRKMDVSAPAAHSGAEALPRSVVCRWIQRASKANEKVTMTVPGSLVACVFPKPKGLHFRNHAAWLALASKSVYGRNADIR